MLNTKKLLYILPDAAYIAEVLPTKKAHTFSIHAFRQINGSFIDDNEFIAENVKKLIHKIEPEEYQLVLPDFLFTNTIVDIKETKESEVKEYLKEKLLPSLDLSKETHDIDTFILTQHAGKSKVQLSALEKSLLDPVRAAAAEQKLTISSISPLSWTIKSVISLEPSLSTIQIGEMLYMALHYIGVDQTISFNISETANIIETVKTLKGAEPNIQTMYLLTNAVVEQQIKEQLSGTLPIQQLTNLTDETEGIPSFIKQIILAGARTLDIPEQPIPRFPLGKELVGSAASAAAPMIEPVAAPEPELTRELPPVEMKKPTTKVLELADDTELPRPSMPLPVAPPVVAAVPKLEIEPEAEKSLEDTPKFTEATRPVPMALSLDDEAELVLKQTEDEEPAETVAEPEHEETPEVMERVVEESAPEPFAPKVETADTVFATPEFKNYKSPFAVDEPEVEEKGFGQAKTPIAPKPELVPVAPVVLPSSYKNTMIQDKDESPEEEEEEEETAVSPTSRKVIKNNNDAGALVKIILITLGALIATVAIGVGIGFGLLKLSEKNNSGLENSPVVQTTPSPKLIASPSPTPTASPSAAIDKTKFKILVVNATSIAGKAGKIKTSLTTAGYKSVTTGNASGSYANPGEYLLVADTHKDMLSSLSKDSGLTLTLGADKATEDPKAAYDAVIVINE